MKFFAYPANPIIKNYLKAKAAMVKLWTPVSGRIPLCSICGRPTRSPEGHHLLGGMGGRRGPTDIRLIVPVCNQSRSDCHNRRAHGGETIQWQRLYYVLGDGDLVEGYRIVCEAAHGSGDIPEPNTEEDVWKI